MIYKDARKKIKSGDLLVWSGNSIFGKIIKLFTRSKYTHVGIAWKIGRRILIIESVEGYGVRIFPASKNLPFYVIHTDVKWTKELESIALSRVGHQYSWTGCVLGFFGINPPKDKRWQCAEFANDILFNAKIVSDKFDTPASLVNELIQKGYHIKSVNK